MTRWAALCGAAAVAMAGLVSCDRARPIVPPANFPTAALNASIDRDLGGLDTCVVLADTRSGAIVYQYGAQKACMRPLPPCATFDIANTLIGLDAGLVTPQTVFKWDGKPQPATAWEKDASLATAFGESIGWWQQALAARIGPDRYKTALKAYDYGSAAPDGPLEAFWMGPAKGGGLQISTREQVAFLRRLYGDKLPVKPEAAAAVQQLLVDETRGQTAVSGRSASCDSAADGSRGVGWWVGRIKAPDRDLLVAASLESENAVPGFEIQNRMKGVLTTVGLLPPS